MEHYVYKISVTNTDLYYIGKRTCRCIQNDEYLGSGSEIKKVSKHLLIKEVLSTHTTSEEAYAQEKKILGDKWKTDPNCLNKKPGGKGAPAGEDHHWFGKPSAYAKRGENHHAFGKVRGAAVRAKIAIGQAARDPASYLRDEMHPGFGKARDVETKRKISEKNKGRILGPFDISHRQKISEGLKKYKRTKEHIEHLRLALSLRTPEERKASRRQKLAFTLDGVGYASLREASEVLGISPYFVKKRINQLPSTGISG